MSMRRGFLVMACAALLAGCSSKVTFGLNMGRVKETRSEIERVIPEKERQVEMQAIVDAYVADAGAIAEEAKALREKVVELNRDYDTPRAEMQAVYDELNGKVEQLIAAAAKHGAELRKLCTKEEWEEIFDHSDDMVNFNY